MNTKPKRRAVAMAAAFVLTILAGCGGKPDYEVYQREETNTVTIPAGKGVEFKLWVLEGDSFSYTWSATRALPCEFHGEPENYPDSPYSSHKNTTGASDSGQHKAAFTGTHGWYWENQGSASVTVTLKTNGVYDIVGETGQNH
jgi:hypothetical protein